MQKIITFFFFFIITTNLVFAQKKVKPYKCGWVVYDTADLRESFEKNLKYWNAKKGETVVSIGAQNGNLEVRYALNVDSINWTLQDIDSSCLNQIEFEKVKSYYEKLGNKKINGNFKLVLGTETSINLPTLTYDRILLINVHHELTKKKEILTQIHACLKANGKLIVMEKMGKKKGKKRKDCHHIMPFEPDFLIEFESLQFKLISKNDSDNVSFYEFEKVD